MSTSMFVSYHLLIDCVALATLVGMCCFFGSPSKGSALGKGLFVLGTVSYLAAISLHTFAGPVELDAGGLYALGWPIVFDVTGHLCLLSLLVLQARELRRQHDENAGLRNKRDYFDYFSHEVRDPMQGLMGFSTLIEEQAQDHRTREYARLLRASASDLFNTFSDCLDFSKCEAGGMEAQCTRFNLRHCLAEEIEPMAQRAAQSGVTFWTDFDPSLPDEVFLDPSKLRKILRNLLSNAIKFSSIRSDGKPGRVHLMVVAVGDNAFKLKVSDNGIGIAEEDHTRIFDPFRQARSDAAPTALHNMPGTGLGLCITSKLVDILGGQIKVDSSLGNGATFTVFLPTAAAQDPQKAKDQAFSAYSARFA